MDLPAFTPEHLLAQQQHEISLQHQQLAELTHSVAVLQAKLDTSPVSRPHIVDKPAKPSTFDGQNLTYSRTWLAELELYFRVIKMKNETDRVNFAAAQLRGNAAEWWMSVAPTDIQIELAELNLVTHPDVVCTWERFKTAFLKIHNPVPVKDAARTALYKLKQTGPVQQYVNKFRYWIQLLNDSMDEETKIFQFRQGLKNYIQRYLLLVKPKTVIEAMSEAIQREMQDKDSMDGSDRTYQKKFTSQYHNSRFRRPGSNNYYNTSSRSTTTTSGDNSTSVPMELGNIIDGEEHDYPRISSVGDHEDVEMNMNAVRLEKLTPAEKERLKKLGLFFRCRVGKYLARDCTLNINDNNNNNRNNRSVRHF